MSDELICELRHCAGHLVAGIIEDGGEIRTEMLCEAADLIESLRSQITTAQATYLQFCKKHDEKMAKAKEALESARESMEAPSTRGEQRLLDTIDAALKELT